MGSGFSGLDAEKGPGHGGSSRTGLEGVPEMCLAVILGYLEPPEICKSAMLNKTFHRASSADFVWESKLPDNYQILVNKLKTSTSTSFNKLIKKDIYAFLSAPNRLGPDFTKVFPCFFFVSGYHLNHFKVWFYVPVEVVGRKFGI